MTKEEITTKVKEIIVDKIGLEEDEITNESTLAHDLGFDDLDTIEVIMEIEVEYSISINDDDLDKIETFEQLVDHTFNLVN